MWPISIDSTIDRIEIEMEEKGKRLSVKNTLVEGICKNIWNRKKKQFRFGPLIQSSFKLSRILSNMSRLEIHQ